MRTQLRTSTDQRRRSSGMVLSSETGAAFTDAAKRRGSNVSTGNGHFLAVPDPKFRRSSLCTSTSALLGIAEGTRKRGSFTSGVSTGSLLLSVPQDVEPRRRSLPGYIEAKSQSLDPYFDRRRSSVRPDEVYKQINDAGTRNMKIFGLVMMFLLALVIGVSFLKLFRWQEHGGRWREGASFNDQWYMFCAIGLLGRGMCWCLYIYKIVIDMYIFDGKGVATLSWDVFVRGNLYSIYVNEDIWFNAKSR